jgi:hypothetical protein
MFSSELVSFRSQDEIAFRQPVDFVGPNGQLNFTPGQVNIRVMPLCFS